MSKIAEGYKQTEVGVIPRDWNAKLMDEASILIASGKSKTKTQVGEAFPIYGSTGIIGFSSKPDYEGERILVARVGANAGTVNYVDGKYCVSDNTLMVQLKKEFDFSFIFYFLKYSNLNKLIFGSGQPLITGTQLKNLSIPLPPTKAEQNAIATALNDADKLITELEILIAKKRNIKKGAMRELLRPKEGWDVKKLGDVLKSTQLGGNYPNSEENTSFPLIKMGNVQRGYISTNKIEYIIEGHKPEKKDRLKYGDVLFNTRNTLELVGKVSIWRDELSEAYFNSNLMRLEFNPKYISSNFFMNYIFNTQHSISRLKDIATGTTSVAAIYTRDLVNIEILLPSLESQTFIAQILSDMDTEIETLEKKSEKYKMLKQGMMQNLLMGRIRLV